MTETQLHDTHCGHPRGCIVQDREGTAICAWCNEVAWLQEKWSTCQRELKESRSVVETIAANFVNCREELRASRLCWQEEQRDYQSKLARLRELIPDVNLLLKLTYAAELWWDDQGEQSHKDVADGYALAEKYTRDSEMTRNASNCLEDKALLGVEVARLREELERLRELIPDAGMLHRLTYAAFLWDCSGEQAQKDIETGYALVEKLHVHKEANIDET